MSALHPQTCNAQSPGRAGAQKQRRNGGRMNRQIVVTIGRSFGSNGRLIGENLARELGIKFSMTGRSLKWRQRKAAWTGRP